MWIVGRQAELRRLSQLVEGGRSAVVSGPAGVGKTTLVRALLGALERPAFVGGALATLSWTSYLPLARALRRHIPGGDRREAVAAIADTVRDGLLVIEDLQWADRETTELLPELTAQLRVLTTLRSDDACSAAAEEAALGAGCHPIRLTGLGREESLELLARTRPGLSDQDLDALVARAAGNPLLLAEMPATGPIPASVQEVLIRRLEPLSSAGRLAIATLALAGRPLRADLLGAGAEELLHLDLARPEGDRLGLRHEVVGELAVARLDDESRRQMHSWLAGVVADPGEAARHHAAAGEAAAASARAMEAAAASNHPGELARHLALAAAYASGPESTAIAIDAARALVAVAEYGQAQERLDSLPGVPREFSVEHAILWARCRLATGDGAGAEEALARLPVPTSEVVTERARLRVWARWQPAEAARMVAEARTAGVASGSALPMADAVAAAAAVAAGTPGWQPAPPGPAVEAGRAGDQEADWVATAACIAGHALAGTYEQAERLATAAFERSRRRGLRHWQLQYQLVQSMLAFHCHASCDTVVEECRRLLEDPAFTRNRDLAIAHLAMALADTGRTGEALQVILPAIVTAQPESAATAVLRWAVVEVQLLAGRLPRAREEAAAAVAAGPAGVPVLQLAALAGAWAEAESLKVGRLSLMDPDETLGRVPATVGGASAERAGLAAFGDPALHGEAWEAFTAAARDWWPYQRRSALRCLWAAGESARLAGNRSEAVGLLSEAEQMLDQHGMRPLLARVRRSLRATGVRRTAPRGVTTLGLTGRERETIELVGQGLSTGEIAHRLGVAPSTVETQMESAVLKLGAKNRLHAAVLLRQQTAGVT